jgi:hypothetical protein
LNYGPWSLSQTIHGPMTRFFLQGCMLLVPFALVGCGSSDLPNTVPVTGTVTMDGTPVDGATVNFLSEQGSIVSGGTTDASGKFSLTTTVGSQSVPGAVVGSHGVAVVKTESSGQEMADPNDLEATKAMMEKMTTNPAVTSEFKAKYVIPQKYNNPAQSQIKAQVTEAGPNDIKIELSSR